MARYRLDLRVVGTVEDTDDLAFTRSLCSAPEPCTVLLLLRRGEYLRIEDAYLDSSLTVVDGKEPRKRTRK